MLTFPFEVFSGRGYEVVTCVSFCIITEQSDSICQRLRKVKITAWQAANVKYLFLPSNAIINTFCDLPQIACKVLYNVIKPYFS